MNLFSELPYLEVYNSHGGRSAGNPLFSTLVDPPRGTTTRPTPMPLLGPCHSPPMGLRQLRRADGAPRKPCYYGPFNCRLTTLINNKAGQLVFKHRRDRLKSGISSTWAPRHQLTIKRASFGAAPTLCITPL